MPLSETGKTARRLITSKNVKGRILNESRTGTRAELQLLLLDTGAFFEPIKISGGIGGNSSAHSALNGRTNSVRDLPAMAGDVAVCVGKIRCAIMIGAGKIAPGVIVEPINEKAVVDRIGMFIEKDEGVGWFAEVCSFEKLHVVRVEAVSEFAGIADHCVHRHAADARTVGSGRFVGRTFVNRCRTIGVMAQLGIGEINEVGVVVIVRPILDVVGPGLATGGRFGFAVIVDQEGIVIIRIKGPGQGQLFDVIGALSGFGTRFRFAQSGQEQTGQNGDNRNDHKHFDESEGAIPHGGTVADQLRIVQPAAYGRKSASLGNFRTC